MQIKKAIAILALITCGVTSHAEAVQGRIVYVEDGDTATLLIDGKSQMTIRFSSIDAPESNHTRQEKGRIGQPYSANSGRYLASLIKNKEVTAQCFENDRYGRAVCEVFLGTESVNRDMVAQGWAWANRAANGRYLRDKTLLDLERHAQANHIGLWAGLNPVAPWEWRDLCWKQGQCPQ